MRNQKQSYYPSYRSALTTIFLVLLTSCSVIGTDNRANDTAEGLKSYEQQWEPVIDNLAGIMGQLFPADDLPAVLVNGEDRSSIYKIAVESLDSKGFTLDASSANLGNELHVTGVDASTPYEYLCRFKIMVGGVGVSRDYTINKAGDWIPASAALITGSNENVVVDDSMLATEEGAGSRLSIAKHSPPTVESQHKQGQVLFDQDDWHNVENTIPVAVKAVATPTAINYFQLPGNHFAGFKGSRELSAKSVVTFISDSATIENATESLLDSIVGLFDPATDVITVIACSNGVTDYDGGNKALASDRADQIMEELRLSGGSSSNVTMGACWSPGVWDKDYPARGAIVEVWRQTAA